MQSVLCHKGVEMKSLFNVINAKKVQVNKKDTAIIIGKVILVILFFVMYLQIFTQKLYIHHEVVEDDRIIVATLLFIFPSVLLFFKFDIPKLLNNILLAVMAIIVVFENYAMMHIASNCDYKTFTAEARNFNLYIMFMIAIVLYAIFNSFKASIIGITVVSTVFAVANYFVILFRGIGLLAVDLFTMQTAANVAEGYSYTLKWRVYILIIVSIAICFLVTRLGKCTATPKWWRIVPVLLAVVMVWNGYNKFFETNIHDKDYKIKYFKPQETYKTNGMYITFVKSIKDLIVKKPKGYSIAKVKEIAKKYPATEKDKNKKSPNIIVIMDEAFTDFSSFSDIKLNKDNAPFFNSLKENTIRGQLWVSVFGGGTASTEFEALTGNSMAFVPNGITAYTTYINEPMQSMASLLKKQGYGGILAMHPFKPSGYSRDKVYPLLGFNKFLSMDDFEGEKHLGNFVSDEGNFDKIISEYENYKKKSDKPFFLFNVTMQNHSPFDYDYEGLSKGVELDSDSNVPEARRYLNLVKHTDDALKMLVQYFKQVDEPTIILFFGDHQPKVEDSFYDEIQKESRLDKEYSKLAKRNTQFILWANYNIESQENLNISANYLSSLVFDVAGLSKSGYQQLTSKVYEQVPVLTKHGYISKEGKFYKVNDKESPYYELLQKYNIAEYNNVFDTENRVKELYECK